MSRKAAKKAQPFRVPSTYGWTTFSTDQWITELQRTAIKIELLMEEHKIDALAVRGSSGMMAGAVLGVALKLPVIYVRKSDEFSHGRKIECNSRAPIKKYLIVDDFACTGSTVLKVIRDIRNEAECMKMHVPECIGVFLYNETSITKSIHNPDGDPIPIFK